MAPMARLLVIANETAASEAVRSTVAGLARSMDADVLVVAPAAGGAGARDGARARVIACVAGLLAAGVRAEGRVGAGDPVLACADALACFPADEIVIATHHEARSHWLAADLVGRTAALSGVTVAHLTVDATAPAPHARTAG